MNSSAAHTRRAHAAGFTLVELAMVLVILALLGGSLLVPLASRIEALDRQAALERLRDIQSALTGFAINRLDRREDLRNKPDAVTALRHRSDTRIAVVAGETPILKRLDGEALTVWFSHGETEMLGPAAEEIFMGMAEDGTPQDFPDFTRGNWKTTKPLGVVA